MAKTIKENPDYQGQEKEQTFGLSIQSNKIYTKDSLFGKYNPNEAHFNVWIGDSSDITDESTEYKFKMNTIEGFDTNADKVEKLALVDSDYFTDLKRDNAYLKDYVNDLKTQLEYEKQSWLKKTYLSIKSHF